ncbi:methyl-accepting chemotaxis protein [Fusibacter ferrireducens]|nr:methyl-accepting chemotaxis protein [Fusibacter ferrireducens]
MLKRLEVRFKIILLSSTLIFLLLLVAGVGYIKLTESNDNLKSLFEVNLTKTQLINDSRAQQRAIEGDIYYVFLHVGDKEKQTVRLKDIEHRKELFDADLQGVRDIGLDEAEIKVFDLLDKKLATYRPIRDEAINYALAGNQEIALKKYSEVEALGEEIQQDLVALASDQLMDAKNVNEYNAADYTKTVKLFVGITIFSLLLGLVLTIFISIDITRPLKLAVTQLSQVASGDFSIDISKDLLKRKDEMGALATGIDEMQNAIKGLIGKVINESKNIERIVGDVDRRVSDLNGDIEDVSSTTQELAAGMEETAAASEEMSATSQEMERAVSSIADKAQEGAVKANEISNRAQSTKTIVLDAQTKAMTVLSSVKEKLEASIEASKVVSQIDVLSESIMNITSQTNLLALNAAIEAARAGEAGKGFAVVADEIRKLAEQSKDTVEEIQRITFKVNEAVADLTGNSNNLLEFVNKDVNEDYKLILNVADKYSEDAIYVDDLVTDFSSTSEELLASITEILKAIDGVAKASTEGAQGTSDIAIKASNVTEKSMEVVKLVLKTNESAQNLESEISKFKV